MSELLTPIEAAERLRLSPTTLRELYYEGKLPYIKLGRKVFIRSEDLEAYVALNVRNPDALGAMEVR